MVPVVLRADRRVALRVGVHDVGLLGRRPPLARSLVGAGIDLRWQPLLDTNRGRTPHVLAPSDAVPADLRRLVAPVEPGEALVVHSVPKAWALVRDELRPDRLIGHSVWETDRLPQRWLVEMDVADELWVPTEWNRVPFAEALRRPVHVVPHAVSSVEPVPAPMALPEDAFVVAVVSAWDWRKRPDLALAACCQAYGPDDPVVVVVKTNRLPISWPHDQHLPTVAHIASVLHRFDRPPRVLVDTADWTEAEVLGLLRRADCFLSTAASEGWGLGAFDAACFGRPVLVSGFGGQVEWLGTDHPGLLPFRMVPAVHPDATLFEPGMWWGEVDLDAAVDALRQLAAGTAVELVSHAAALGPVLQARYAEDEVGRVASSVLPDAVRRRAQRRA